MTTDTSLQPMAEMAPKAYRTLPFWPILAVSLMILLSATVQAAPFAYATKGDAKLYKIDLADGASHVIGSTALPGMAPITIPALALSPDGLLYGISGSQFFSINTQTGALREINRSISTPNEAATQFFALTFNGATLLGPDAGSRLITINPATGVASQGVNIGSNLIIQAMTMLNSTTALVTADGGVNLYTLNVQTGSVSPIGALPGHCLALTMASDHKLYALDISENLYSVDPATAAGTLIGTSGSRPSPWMDMVAIPAPMISDKGVLNAASLLPSVAPGTLATIFGTGFAPTAAATPPPTQNSVAPLPTTLGGVSVVIDGVPAPIYFAGWNQISFQVPYETAPGSAHLTVTSPSGTTVFPFTVHGVAPGIFSSEKTGLAVAKNASGHPIDNEHPANPGDRVTVYLTGQGLLFNPVPTGHPAPPAPLSKPIASFSATVGGSPAAVYSVEMAPGLIGVFQVELIVPVLPAADHQIVVTATLCAPMRGCASQVSNSATLPVAGTAPHIDSIVVWYDTHYASSFTGITLHGSNFDPQWSKIYMTGGWCDVNPGSCVVTVNGSTNTTLISATQAPLPAGTYKVFVQNWLPQYGVWSFSSNIVTLVLP